jgi:acyl dehydratase
VAGSTAAPARMAPWTCYDDIVVGSSFAGKGRTITDADVLLFTALTTGFHQPLHTDLEWIRSHTSFPERLLPGPAILAYAIGLLSATLIYSDITVAFAGLDKVRAAKPMVAGDTMTATAMVQEKRLTSNPTRGIVVLAIAVRNQRGEEAMTFLYTLMVRGKEPTTGDDTG